MPAKAAIQYAQMLRFRGSYSPILKAVSGYWIARIIKLVLGLAKPDPSAGQ
jgi:hypothetical protein